MLLQTWNMAKIGKLNELIFFNELSTYKSPPHTLTGTAPAFMNKDQNWLPAFKEKKKILIIINSEKEMRLYYSLSPYFLRISS